MENDLKVGDLIVLFTSSRMLLPSDTDRYGRKKGKLVIVQVAGVLRTERTGSMRSYHTLFQERQGKDVPQVETRLEIHVRDPKNANKSIPVRLLPGRWTRLQ
jgi:hypothetical protein